jgi:YrbI family 3-deoxy-D-manno-octulosonate 8-phosphate phosphatase
VENTEPEQPEVIMSVVAIIPARGGSRGISGKNLKRVGGVTLLARAVASALAAESIDRVVVSTDDDAIAAAATVAGAEVIRRPAALADDAASPESALLHALERMSGSPRIIVFIQATSPFIDPLDLDFAVSRVRDGECDVAFSAVETSSFLWRATPEGAVGVNHDHSVRPRRGDRETQYEETGGFYVMRTAGFRQAGFRFFGRIEVALVDRVRAIEIDNPEDLAIARSLAPLAEQALPIDIDALVTDFDGVHTDDLVSIGGDGSERVTTSRSDGAGIERLRNAGYPLLILSRETNRVVTARARKLGVDVRQGVEDKAAVLEAWVRARGLDPARVAYVGNDVNDLGCLELVGWPIAVLDAHPEVIAAARVVLTKPGGHGAIREVAERILLCGVRTRPLQEERWPSPLVESL